ncbi:MAG TPA: hypothetical protein VFN18_05505 [Solirubrobacterales bacterium]|nr:hypothetical protein [Solirubrobacterales bacterium]
MSDIAPLRHALRPAARVLIALLGLMLAVASTAGASSAMRAEASDALYVPNAFRLEGTNGFTLDVIGTRPFHGHPASLTIYASRGGSGVRYIAPATVTETVMQADLGDLGQIALSFTPTNLATKVPCGKRTIAFDSGLFEGTFRFHGEEGFTSADVSTVPGNLDFELAPYCSRVTSDEAIQPVATSGAQPGAELNVHGPGLGADLTVRKKRRGAAAEVDVWFSEYVDGIRIDRYAYRRVPSAAFTYDRRVRKASLHPRAPFSGSARFDLTKKAGQRWSGDLTMDLPGKRSAPLVAPTLRATLRPV